METNYANSLCLIDFINFEAILLIERLGIQQPSEEQIELAERVIKYLDGRLSQKNIKNY